MKFQGLKTGDVLVGRYLIQGEIGAGAMGVVYLAKHKTLERYYAIKVMTSLVDAPEEMRDKRLARFEREAHMLSLFDHPNVPTIHDFWIEDSVAFLAMEYLQGKDLGHVLDKQGTLSVTDALYVGIEVAKPLSVAHQKNIVHRDVKPDNIMCCIGQPPEGKGVIRLLDFGIAKLDLSKGVAGRESSAEGKPLPKLTAENAIIGTMPYAPPEMFKGKGAVDQRSDIWALGIVLFECLAGYPFFRDAQEAPSAMQLAVAVMTEPLPPLDKLRSDVPPRLVRAIEKMLAKLPSERFATMIDVYDELWAILSEEQLKAETQGRALTSIFRKAGLVLPAQSPIHRPVGWISKTGSTHDTVEQPALSRRPDPVAPPPSALPAASVGPEDLARDEPKPVDDWIAAAIGRLEKLGDEPATKEALETLRRGLQVASPVARRAAAASLAKRGDETSIGALEEALSREFDHETQAAMRTALDQIRPRVAASSTPPQARPAAVMKGGTERLAPPKQASDAEIFGSPPPAPVIGPSPKAASVGAYGSSASFVARARSAGASAASDAGATPSTGLEVSSLPPIPPTQRTLWAKWQVAIGLGVAGGVLLVGILVGVDKIRRGHDPTPVAPDPSPRPAASEIATDVGPTPAVQPAPPPLAQPVATTSSSSSPATSVSVIQTASPPPLPSPTLHPVGPGAGKVIDTW